jgi:hypothetical protein
MDENIGCLLFCSFIYCILVAGDSGHHFYHITLIHVYRFAFCFCMHLDFWLVDEIPSVGLVVGITTDTQLQIQN